MTCCTFAECAPDLSDPMSAARYAAEEISEAKDGFVRYLSDEEGMTTHSYQNKQKNINKDCLISTE